MKHAGLRTLAVTAATLAIVVGAGFSVQAAVLGRPGRAPLLAVQVVRRLVAYHSSSARETIDGRQLSAACTQRWSRTGHTATVSVADGPTLAEIGNHLLTTQKVAVAEFELAGCPRPLARWLAVELDRGAPLQIRPVSIDGKRTLALRFGGSPLGLKLFVERGSGLPVALSVSGAGVRGASRLRYGNRSSLLAREAAQTRLEAR